MVLWCWFDDGVKKETVTPKLNKINQLTLGPFDSSLQLGTIHDQ